MVHPYFPLLVHCYFPLTSDSKQVLDAVHIYNVTDIIDKEKTCKIQIAWSDNGHLASLLINDYCHAVFDFKNRAGYCRNAFPANMNGWVQKQDRQLTDELISVLFAKV